MPQLLNILMGRAGLLLAPAGDVPTGGTGVAAFEAGFTGADPDDSDTPGATQDTGDVLDEAGTAPAPAPAAPAPAPKPEADPGADPAEPPPAPPAPPAAPAAPAAPAEAPAAAPEAEPEYQPPEQERARLAPADAPAQIEALTTEREKAFSDYDEGLIDKATYQEIQRRTSAAEMDLQRKLAADQAADTLESQAQVNLWNTIHTDAVRELQRAGIRATEENLAEFNALIGAFGRAATAKGLSDGADITASRYALGEAKRVFMLSKGVAAAAPAAPAAAPKAPPTRAEAEAARAIDRSKLPPSLTSAPPAADPTIAGEEFAHIDALDGVAQERAIAKLTDEQRDRYLAQ